MSDFYGYEGFQDLINEFEEYIKSTENVTEVLEVGAEEFVFDLRKLPKPISKIKKSGYTHLVNTFAYKTRNKEVEVGWGKYYGPMVENGTKKMSARPHLKPLWNRNKEKYYKKMITKLGLQTW